MLNPQLYTALVNVFKRVKIAKEGQPLVYDVVNTIGKDEYVIRDYGETYRVCCPFCAARTHHDTRFRLWISHAWGLHIGGRRMWSLATCFHSDCLEDKFFRNELINTVFGKAADRYRPVILEGHVQPKPVPNWPGECLPLEELSEDHPACRYLSARGFDPATIGRRYKVRYCYDSDEYPLAMDRIVIPVIHDGVIRGWQCRYIGTPRRHVPKYFTAPGMQIKHYLYDGDVALRQNRLVLVEGVMDVWSVGEGAAALFGKTISQHQYQFVAASKAEEVVIFLDPDAGHNREVLRSMLEKTRKRVVCVTNAEKDPADLGRDGCAKLIEEAIGCSSAS